MSFSPTGITAGPDGGLWFTETGGPDRIGRIATDGTATGYSVPTSPSYPAIIAGPDEALWFTEFFGNKIGRPHDFQSTRLRELLRIDPRDLEWEQRGALLGG